MRQSLGPRYSSGEEVIVGDRIQAEGPPGSVVFVIERDEWSPSFPREQWGYLGSGFMVLEDDGTLIHYSETNDCMVLLSRSGDSPAA